MIPEYTIQFKVKGLSRALTTLTATSIEDARNKYEALRDSIHFGSSELLSKIRVRKGVDIVAEIWYNGTIIHKKKKCSVSS